MKQDKEETIQVKVDRRRQCMTVDDSSPSEAISSMVTLWSPWSWKWTQWCNIWCHVQMTPADHTQQQHYTLPRLYDSWLALCYMKMA